MTNVWQGTAKDDGNPELADREPVQERGFMGVIIGLMLYAVAAILFLEGVILGLSRGWSWPSIGILTIGGVVAWLGRFVLSYASEPIPKIVDVDSEVEE